MFEGLVGIFLDSSKIVAITFNSHRLVCFPRMNPNVHFPVCTQRNGFVGYHLEKRTIDNENKSNSCHIHHTWMSQEVSKWLVNGLSPTYKGLGVETERVQGVETERAIMLGPLFTTGGRNRTRKCQKRDRRVWQGLRAESTDVDVARRQGCALCSRRGLSSGAINLRGPTAKFLDAGTRESSRTSLLVRS